MTGFRQESQGHDKDLLDHDGNNLEDNSTTKKHRVNQYVGYTDAVWGTKTHGWAASTSHLNENKWKLILQAAVEQMDMMFGCDDGNAEEDANGRVLDPCALIEI